MFSKPAANEVGSGVRQPYCRQYGQNPPQSLWQVAQRDQVGSYPADVEDTGNRYGKIRARLLSSPLEIHQMIDHGSQD